MAECKCNSFDEFEKIVLKMSKQESNDIFDLLIMIYDKKITEVFYKSDYEELILIKNEIRYTNDLISVFLNISLTKNGDLK